MNDFQREMFDLLPLIATSATTKCTPSTSAS